MRKKLRQEIALIMAFAMVGCSTPGTQSVESEKTTDTEILTDADNETKYETEEDSKEDSKEEDTVTIEDEEEDTLNESQKNSIAMLNYLAFLSQEVNSSKNSRMFLEEAYASLINNTNPEKVNELTESHLSSLLDIIEKYRMVNVKRERLQYLYDQKKHSQSEKQCQVQ